MRSQANPRKARGFGCGVPLLCVTHGACAIVLCFLAASASRAAPTFSLDALLSYPFPMTLVAAPDGRSIAYAIDQRGIRSIWLARAPEYAPQRLVVAGADDGQDFNELAISPGATHVVYVRGGGGTSPPDPDAAPAQPHQAVWSVDTASGVQKNLGDGSAAAISPDGARVAFERDGAVWSAPLDGSATARRLFYDRGRDSDLRWSPAGNALAFVSSRGDHAFIGVYRDPRTPLEFLAPSTGNDAEPRWSPDGTRIAFARRPGDGGAIPSPLQPLVVPWSIWVARVADGMGAPVWQSPKTPRASFPTEGGDVNLNWAANDRLVFVCEMDNWPHLYSVPATGGAAHLLTPGAFSVGAVNVSSDGHLAFYDANTGTTPGDIDRWHLYRVDVATGRNVTLTQGTGSEWWAMPLRDGKLAYVAATAQQPPLVNVASLRVATRARRDEPRSAGATLLGDAHALDRALLPAGFPAPQLVTPRDVTFRAPDGTLVHGQLFARAASAKRPGVVFVHGGPMRRMLLTWNPMDYYSNAYAVDQALVNRGFAVLSVNYRTGTDYGHDFHYALRAGWTGASEYQDVLAGARFLQREPSVDPARIGIWGGSWGGYLTALALARNSDVFKAGVDFHGVHDLTHDVGYYFGTSKTTYPIPNWPRWLRLAWDSSPDSAIATWRSPVLLIQGDADPDVSFHQMVDVVERLQAHHVPFEQLVLPNEVHGFLRYASWFRADQATIAFLERHLER